MSRSPIPRLHSVNCICYRCQAHRRKLQREAERPRRVPAEDVSEVILQARAAGMTFKAIAEVAGVSPSTLHRIVHGGVQVDPRHRRRSRGSSSSSRPVARPLAAERPPDSLGACVSRKRGEQLERLPFRAEPGAAGVLPRRPQELHFLEAKLDGDVVGGTGFAEADAETVELGTDLIGRHEGS